MMHLNIQTLRIVCRLWVFVTMLQLSRDVNFVWRLAKATHFKSKIESERDKNEEKRLAYLSRDLAARSIEIDPDSAAAHKWQVVG